MYHRTMTPGAWVFGATLSADELNALDLSHIRITATGSAAIADAFGPLIEACKRAEVAADRALNCHHCGAPSPGDVCRYCNTVHRRTT